MSKLISVRVVNARQTPCPCPTPHSLICLPSETLFGVLATVPRKGSVLPLARSEVTGGLCLAGRPIVLRCRVQRTPNTILADRNSRCQCHCGYRVLPKHRTRSDRVTPSRHQSSSKRSASALVEASARPRPKRFAIANLPCHGRCGHTLDEGLGKGVDWCRPRHSRGRGDHRRTLVHECSRPTLAHIAY